MVFGVFVLFMLLVTFSYIKYIRIKSIAWVALFIAMFWSCKNLLSAGTNAYLKLSCLYAFLWFLLIIFSDLFFYRILRNRTLMINLFFVLFLLSVLLNVFSLFYFRDRGILLAPLIYNSLIFLPWLLLLNGVKRNLSLLLLLCVVIFSAKRGAIFILVLEMFVLSWIAYRKRYLNRRIFVYLIGGVLVFVGLFCVASEYSDGYIVSRFQKDALLSGSGRSDINQYGMDAVSRMSSLKEFLFGYPLNSDVLNHFGGHNDWLTFFLSYGIVGVILYAFFYLNMLVRLFFLWKKNDMSLLIAYASLFIIMFMMSFFSTSYNPTLHPIIGMMFIGYTEANRIKKVVV